MSIKFAVLAPGHIANSIARALEGAPELERYAVGSRELSRARAFAEQWGFQKSYGSYEDLLSDPEVELVYVASPHSHHYAHAKLCLEYGKHVLVEKSFTVNASQAEELMKLAQAKRLLLAEAIWTRYMPSRRILRDLLDSGVIGEYRMLTANLGYPLTGKARLMTPELAGGALLDVGVYTINFARMMFPGEIDHISGSVQLTDTGVDGINSVTIYHCDGKVAQLFSSLYSATDRRGIIYGEKGYLEVQNINNPEYITIYNNNHEALQRVEVPAQINGYEYQLQACVRAIKEGRTECPEMPHEDILEVMRIMDEVRAQWGFRYPEEIEAL